MLLAKGAIVLFLVALGAYNNRYAVPRLRQQVASVKEQRRFLRAAGAEVALFVAAIGVTAVLVAEPPAKAFVAPSGPVVRTAPVGPYELNLVVDPAEKGLNNIHLYLLAKNGQPAKVAEAEVEATLPDPGIGPLRLETHPAGPGHFAVHGASLPLAGDWDLDVSVRRGEFNLWRAMLSIPIRKG